MTSPFPSLRARLSHRKLIVIGCLILLAGFGLYTSVLENHIGNPSLPPLQHFYTKHDHGCWGVITDAGCFASYYYVGYGTIPQIVEQLTRQLPAQGYVVQEPDMTTVSESDFYVDIYTPADSQRFYRLEFITPPKSAQDIFGAYRLSPLCLPGRTDCVEVYITK